MHKMLAPLASVPLAKENYSILNSIKRSGDVADT